MSAATFSLTPTTVGSSTLRSRASRQLSGTSAAACSDRIHMPGRAPRRVMSPRRRGRSGNFSFARSHVPAPLRLAPRPGCHPSSITTNGRFAPAGDSSMMCSASASTVAALLLPYA